MLFTMTEKDILRNKIVEPAFYIVQINDIKLETSKAGDSTNVWLEGEIVKNADTGDEKYKGVPTPFLWMYNSKAIGNATSLLEALGETVGEGYRFDPDFLKGKRVVAWIANGEYQGDIQNQISLKKFRPLSSAKAA